MEKKYADYCNSLTFINRKFTKKVAKLIEASTSMIDAYKIYAWSQEIITYQTILISKILNEVLDDKLQTFDRKRSS